jgi:hypothetical protein
MDDPYMRDANIGGAATMMKFGWLALGAGLAAAAGGWFGFSVAIGIAVGIVCRLVVSALMLSHYGGRSTR